MTIATSEARLNDVLRSVSGVGRVHDHIRTETDRELAEEYILDAAARVNVWEFEVNTEAVADGAGGLMRTEGQVDVVAHYYIDDESNSRGVFRDILARVGLAIANRDTGFVQIKDGIVDLVEPPTPVRMRTGHAAYRARLSFRLFDFEPT